MSFSRLLRSAGLLAVLVTVTAAAWLGFQHLAADGLSTIDAFVVGVATFVTVTVVAFAKA